MSEQKKLTDQRGKFRQEWGEAGPIPPLVLTADDSAYIKAMNKTSLSVEQVARIYGIPLHLLKGK